MYRARFDSKKVDIRNIRGAIKILGVGIAEDATLGAVFGMVRQVFHNHEARGGKSVIALGKAMGLLGLSTSGKKQALVGRIHNTFAPLP